MRAPRDQVDVSCNETEPRFALARCNAAPDTWFTQEVIAYGSHIVIKVNGKITAAVDVANEQMNFKRGHFAFQFHDPTCRVAVRKVMVRELPSLE